MKFTKQEWVSELVSESVSDKGKQWSDSGPIKIQKYLEIEYIKRYEKVKQNDWDKTKKSKLALFAAWVASTWSS